MIADRIKTFKRVKVTDLIDNPKNWRKHPDAQRNALGGLLESVGWADAVLARETDEGLMLIDGHLRKELAADSKVPVLILDVTEAEADLILATHDPLTSMAETDQALLDELVQGLDIDNDETQKMLDELASDPVIEVVEDEVPEVPADPTTKLGDLFELGDHRLLCGDCTSADNVAKLMDGAKADLLLTDPPYGIKRDKGFGGSGGFGGGSGTPIKRRTYSDDWDSCRPSVETFDLIIKEATISLIFGGNYFADILPMSTHWLVWDKENTMPTFGDCELVWTNSDRKSVSIYRHTYNGLIGKERERHHPTQKPVELFVDLLNDYSTTDSIILDPFLGSGTTLIAAEQIGRKCYGMEISPAYCDVIIQRWENLTGKKAKKV